MFKNLLEKIPSFKQKLRVLTTTKSFCANLKLKRQASEALHVLEDVAVGLIQLSYLGGPQRGVSEKRWTLISY